MRLPPAAWQLSHCIFCVNLQAQDNVLANCRQKYVEEQLAKRLGRPAPGASDTASVPDPEQDLYTVPEELQVSTVPTDEHVVV